MGRSCLALGLILLGLSVVGCGRTSEPTPAPAAFKPQQFPDVPVPPGYGVDPDSDQLALSLADGQVRRYCVAYTLPDGRRGPVGPELLDWMTEQLTVRGWVLERLERDAGRGWWLKAREGGDEILRVETAETGRERSLRLVLAPRS